MSFWFARLRHRLGCRSDRFCHGHTYYTYPQYPSDERQFGRLQRYYAPGSIWTREGSQ